MTSSLTRFTPRQRPVASGRALAAQPAEFIKNYIQAGEAAAAAPFIGVTTNGAARSGLFPLGSTGAATGAVVAAAEAFLASLAAEQRTAVVFPVDSDAWRRWSNIHVYTMRHGVSLEDLSAEQRERALALLGASLSPRGSSAARDVMKLNETIGEMTDRFEEYGEWLYWLSVLGTPSGTEPWGW